MTQASPYQSFPNSFKRDLLAGPPRVTACARRSERRVALAELATATQWDTDPQATVAAVRRSKCNQAFARTRSSSIVWQMRRSSARERIFAAPAKV